MLNASGCAASEAGLLVFAVAAMGPSGEGEKIPQGVNKYKKILIRRMYDIWAKV